MSRRMNHISRPRPNGGRNVVAFHKSELPAAAHNRRPKFLGLDDMHPSQQAQARNAEIYCIYDDNERCIYAPTGNVALAFDAFHVIIGQEDL